jgi:hypothetical protein
LLTVCPLYGTMRGGGPQGGMFYVELLTQPPQAKRVRQWTMSSGAWRAQKD